NWRSPTGYGPASRRPPRDAGSSTPPEGPRRTPWSRSATPTWAGARSTTTTACRSPRCKAGTPSDPGVPRPSQVELEPLVTGDEAEGGVEAVGVGALLVAGELDQAAAALAAPAHRPLHHPPAEPLPAEGGGHPHGLDLQPLRATAGQARNEGELHRAHHLATGLHDDQLVARIGVDRLEGGQVLLFGAGGLPFRADRVVCQQGDDRRNVLSPCLTERHGRPIRCRRRKIHAHTPIVPPASHP